MHLRLSSQSVRSVVVERACRCWAFIYLFIYFFGYFCRSLSAEVKSTGEAFAISILCVYVGDLMLGGWSLIIRLRLDAYKSIKRSDELRESSSSVRIPQKR